MNKATLDNYIEMIIIIHVYMFLNIVQSSHVLMKLSHSDIDSCYNNYTRRINFYIINSNLYTNAIQHSSNLNHDPLTNK